MMAFPAINLDAPKNVVELTGDCHDKLSSKGYNQG